MNIFCGHYTEVLTVFDQHLGVDLVLVENSDEKNRSVIKYCDAQNIKYVKVGSSAEVAAIDVVRVEACLVASFGYILKRSFIQKCKYVINFHPGDIQRRRGRHPLPQAILGGDNAIKIAAIQILDTSIDAGPVICEATIPLNYAKSFDYNHSKLKYWLTPMTAYVCDQIKSDSLIGFEYSKLSVDSYQAPVEPDALRKIVTAENLERFR